MGLRAELTALPPRDQARRLAAIAEALVARIAATEADTGEAEAALAALRAWGGGAALAGRDIRDLVYSERECGVLRRLSDAAGRPDESAWNALTTAMMYLAWLVHRETGEPMPSDVDEVDEGTLELLEEQLAS